MTRIARPVLQRDILCAGDNPWHRSTTPSYGAEKRRVKAWLQPATLVGAPQHALNGHEVMRRNAITNGGCVCRGGPGRTDGLLVRTDEACD